MDLSFDFQIKKLSGEAYEGDQNHAGKLLAEALSAGNKGQSIKFFDWAVKLWNKEKIVVDATDFDVLRAWIDTNEFVNILCKAQWIKSMEEQKQKEDKKSKK
jgi:hypothetical protein